MYVDERGGGGEKREVISKMLFERERERDMLFKPVYGNRRC